MIDTLSFVVCSNCWAKNRLSEEKLPNSPKCGKCGHYLFQGKPVKLDDNTFMKFVQNTSIPVVVDFWAEWCGPCKIMAPVFEQAAGTLEPGVRVAKLNVEEAPMVSSQFRIQSIPTIAIFKDGQVIAQRAGAMGIQDLINWIRQSV